MASGEMGMRIQQTTFLLRSIWEIPSWRDDLLAAFEQWVREGASRSEAKGKLKTMIETLLPQYRLVYPLDIDLAHVHWEQLTEFFCVCYYRKRYRRSLPEVPPWCVWKELSDQQNRGPLSLHPQQDDAIQETVPVPRVPLKHQLHELGGRYMPSPYEPHLDLILQRGQVFDEPVEFVPGEPNHCHENVALMWKKDQEAFSIATGYALADDGWWRQHSWVIRKHPTAGQARIVETTVLFERYFGVLLNDREAEAFWRNN
jgi:hypothetical protein